MDGAREVAWAVTRTGYLPAQVEAEFGALVGDVERAWARAFPAQLGYCTRAESWPNGLVRLHVRRGDFVGTVDLACDWGHEGAAQIRAVSAARSDRLRAVEASGERTVRRARWTATALGGAMGIGFCWLAAGVQMPVVGGLMLTIIVTSLLVGGGNLGARVGEGVASHRCRLVELALAADERIQADIQRWKSLNRQLRGHRRALARGRSGAPFRREASLA